MAARIGINGFGRIGRCVLRALHERHLHQSLQVVVINELTDLPTLKYITQYDSTHGRFPGTLDISGQQLLVNGQSIELLNQADLDAIDWQPYALDLLMECTGTYSERALAERQVEQGATRLLFSHPAHSDVDATVIAGFNDDQLQGHERIVSAGSCSTNCVIPILATIDQHFGIERGVTTTIHSAMNDQPVIDAYHSNLRRTRAAVSSIIPVDTQLPKGIERLMPQLAGCFESLHVRVPTLNVSVMDLSLHLKTQVQADHINALLQQTAERLPHLFGYSREPHASVDFNHDPRSGIIDSTQTRVSDGRLVKIFIWFDNEWGFANRMIDAALALLSPTR
jgi:D-erythrose 4-phosphate dehydrogenase